MTVRKITLTGLALAVTLLLLLSGCNITVNWWPGVLDPEAGLSFSLEWSDNGTDVPHLYMTYPAPADWDTTDDDGTPAFEEPYLPPPLGIGDLGFDPFDIGDGVPDETTDTRGAVHSGNRKSGYLLSGIPAVEMTEEKDAYEIILVRGFPFDNATLTYNTVADGSASDLTGLAPGDYAWVGVMEAYAYATSGQLEYASGEGDGVDAVLNVFINDEILAVYELPANTDLKGSSIVRINCFYDEAGYEVYQLVPDIRVIQSTTQIRSVAPGTVIDESGIITVRMPVAE